jgi:hypothetical protein
MTDIYTPEIEKRLIQYYNETCHKYFNKLKPFINYTDEIKEIFLEDALPYCKSKQDRYNKSAPLLNDGSINTPFTFFATILKNETITRSQSLLCYLDETKSSHESQVALNGHIWKGVLNKAKRENLLKELC